jgi:hypothetical protein
MAIGPANGMKAKGEQVSAAPNGPCCGLRYAGWTGAGIGDAGPAAAMAGPNAITGTVAAATIAARSEFLVMVILLVAAWRTARFRGALGLRSSHCERRETACHGRGLLVLPAFAEPWVQARSPGLH